MELNIGIVGGLIWVVRSEQTKRHKFPRAMETSSPEDDFGHGEKNAA